MQVTGIGTEGRYAVQDTPTHDAQRVHQRDGDEPERRHRVDAPARSGGGIDQRPDQDVTQQKAARIPEEDLAPGHTEKLQVADQIGNQRSDRGEQQDLDRADLGCEEQQ